MATGDVKRKLTAIFSADVEGYSRLMEEDELATIETLTSHKEIMRKMIRQYSGRVVDSTGDNLLAEFGSVVDAVQCAVGVQQVLSSKNEDLTENRKMLFRIGINLGDVVEEGKRIYGDGVNVAARVESLAEGGGISVSGTAYDQLGKKLPLGYEYLGEQTVKNIEKPVRVYRILTEAEAAGKVIGEIRPKTKQMRGVAIGAVAVLIIVAGALAIWNFYFRPAFEPASVEKMAFPLPDKPSIAVLPLLNMSGNPDQDYIADGITENITTALSNIPGMFVSAYNRSSPYKGKDVKLQEVAHNLGVRYLLNGSMQKSGDKIRVTAQLVDALAGRQLWSEKYDREMKDFFQVMDEITLKIILELQVKLTHGEQVRKWYGTTNLEVWGYVAEGLGIFENYSIANNEKARELFKKALEIEPENVRAWVMLGWTHLIEVRFGWTKNPAESMKNAVKMAQKALSVDDKSSEAHCLLSSLYSFMGQHEKAIAEGQKSIEFGPNSAESHILVAQTMYYAGKFDDSIALGEQAVRLSPNCGAWYWIILGRSYMLAGRYQDALVIFEKLLELAQGREYDLWRANHYLAVTYSLMGQTEKAQTYLAEARKFNSKYSLEYVRRINFFKDPNHLEAILDALRKAGLTDESQLPLPDKPSIAVLPFVNMSGDPKQEYFSDGISEEIITALSKTPKMFVIARTSSFKYKGKKVDVRTVGRELGVRYVLEGSVRKGGDNVRITAQLVDAKTGSHLWAERYDRGLKDIFAMQDEITMKILIALQIKLTEGEQAHVYGKGTQNLEAYLLCLQAEKEITRLNKDGLVRARQMVQEATTLDPSYARAYHFWALTYVNEVILTLTREPRQSLARGMELEQKALALDDSLSWGHALLGWLYTLQGKHDKGITECEQAVRLEPNSAAAYFYLSLALKYAGRAKESIAMSKEAIRLDPIPISIYYQGITTAYCHTGQYEEAITAGKKAVDLQPNNMVARAFLAVAYSLSGKDDEAIIEAKEVMRINPKFSVDEWAKTMPYKNEVDREMIIAALRKAGLK